MSLVCYDTMQDRVDEASDLPISMFVQDSSLPFWSVEMLYKIMIGWHWIQKGGRGTLNPWNIRLPRYIWRCSLVTLTESQRILNSIYPTDYEEVTRLQIHSILFDTSAKLGRREHLKIKNGLIACARFLACSDGPQSLGVFAEVDGSDDLNAYRGLRSAKLRVLDHPRNVIADDIDTYSTQEEVGENAQNAPEDGKTTDSRRVAQAGRW